MTRIERLKLVTEYKRIRGVVEGGGAGRVERMRSMVRLKEIREALGAGAEPESPAIAFLRSVLTGASDALGLADLLDKLSEAINSLNGDGGLIGDIEDLADRAITHWAELEASTA